MRERMGAQGLLAIFAILLMVADVLAQTAPKGIATVEGACRVTLNGTDVGCGKGAVHAVLQNGRHLINFGAKDLATVGFAGARLDVSTNDSSVLWLDAVYVNQERHLADGQCELSASNGRAELKCSAVLRDGRKLAASLEGGALKEPFLGLKPPSSLKV